MMAVEWWTQEVLSACSPRPSMHLQLRVSDEACALQHTPSLAPAVSHGGKQASPRHAFLLRSTASVPGSIQGHAQGRMKVVTVD
jgi:hypothetical protein